jgi:hypothetical protein
MRMRNLSTQRVGKEKPATLSRDGFSYPRSYYMSNLFIAVDYAVGVAGSVRVDVPAMPPFGPCPPLPPL